MADRSPMGRSARAAGRDVVGNAEGQGVAATVVAVWAAYALFRIAQTSLLGLAADGEGMSLGRRIFFSFADGGMMALMTPLALWAARRFPLRGRGALTNIAAHALLASATTAAGLGTLYAAAEGVFGARPVLSASQFVITWATPNFFAYAVVVAVGHLVEAQRRLRERELHASRLEGQLTAARLESLRAQLQPHFLFNTLHAISESIHSAPRTADAMVVKLGTLLRRTLDAGSHALVPLSHEIDYVRAYLDIHALRLGERLQVSYLVDGQAEGMLVPPLVLQPLVENVVKHALTPSVSTCRVWIGASLAEGRLRLTVADDGAGAATVADGIGLSNVRARLEELYPGDHSVRVETSPGHGMRVTLDLPVTAGGTHTP